MLQAASAGTRIASTVVLHATRCQHVWNPLGRRVLASDAKSVGRYSRQYATKQSAVDERISNAARKKASWARSRKTPAFVDSLEIQVEGGTGGDGCVAFARDKFKPYGPPSGGGGGPGGSIYVRTREGIASLARLPGRVEGGRGENGVSDWQAGKAGFDRYIDVPVGTIVHVEHTPIDERPIEVIRQDAYRNGLVLKYRNAFLRERHSRRRQLPASLFPEIASINDDLLEQREQRELVWRHYSGAVLPVDTAKRDSQSTALEPERQDESNIDDTMLNIDQQGTEEVGTESSEEAPLDDPHEEVLEAVDLEREEAESDIRPLGPSFRNSEKRFAFWLISERLKAASTHLFAAERSTAREALEQESDGSSEPFNDASWTTDLDTHSETPLLVAHGGSGGLGNSYFASAQTRSPTSATRGSPGESITLRLEWKIKGDIGLIGMPNAGKSTFLKSVCAAGDSVRIAGYAFTTLQPNLGIVRIGEQGTLLGAGVDDVVESRPTPLVVGGSRAETATETQSDAAVRQSQGPRRMENVVPEDEVFRFTLQDLPGLVEGAAANRGLGHDFLKHVERCTALYYVIDVSTPEEGDTSSMTASVGEPWVDMELVHAELESYRAGLSQKVQGVLANKCDILEETEAGRAVLYRLGDEARRLHGGRSIPVYPMSARKRLGVQEAIHAMARVVQAARQAEQSMDV